MTRPTKKEIFQILDSGKVSVTNAQAIKEYINYLLSVGAKQIKEGGVQKWPTTKLTRI